MSADQKVPARRQIELKGRHGVVVTASLPDLSAGIDVRIPEGLSDQELIADMLEIGAAHSTDIRPNLSEFSGYDRVRALVWRPKSLHAIRNGPGVNAFGGCLVSPEEGPQVCFEFDSGHGVLKQLKMTVYWVSRLFSHVPEGFDSGKRSSEVDRYEH